MDSLIIEGVRCFAERQTIRLRPITLLTGENSTGKSTVLALVRIGWELCCGNPAPNFNEEPFLLGAYDEIACYRGGRSGRVGEFVIGAQFRLKRHPEVICVDGLFTSKDGQPALRRLKMQAAGEIVKFEFGDRQTHIEWQTGTGCRKLALPFGPSDMPFPSVWGLVLTLYPHDMLRGPATGTIAEGKRAPSKGDDFLESLPVRLSASSEQLAHQRPHAFAPIRTRPHRTYDPLRSEPEPEGRHVPMVLATLSASDPTRWLELREALDVFGKQSGLFRDVEVRHMGGGAGPFQVRVKVSGPSSNLVDVGYGVSQVLPIVVDMLRGAEGITYLLQQPEVHLHPKAQAQLGSLFALLAKQQRKRFVIETHSDHLVDRVRMEVRDGKLKPEDVSLLYFERRRGNVRIHQIDLDMMGNIVNPPRGYRQFFLDEMRAFLGG